ncbi:Rieske (2Fe-2S) protein [Pseudonocardia broussonetiae]|uniref:Rieske (2Fe-2S) protein n=1 Tax=Pseudonocardia broussonetiae TaxID=2736640 RepID=UPI0019664615|nr:Rieske (2Fe-2S) protein [Pseudonocardia broussonetiae]
MPDAQIDRRTVVIGAAALTAGLTVAGCAAGAGSAPAASGPLAAADVPVGGATIFADRAVVVTQATAGSFAAFSTVCPHQGCNVNAVEGAEIVCPCHDSRFDLTGAVLTGPAESGLAAVPVTVSGSELTLD